MFGLYFESICPNCGKKHNVDLGACTAYYTVNDSELEYTPYTCPKCVKSYWLAHTGTGIPLETKKRNVTDKVRREGVICW